MINWNRYLDSVCQEPAYTEWERRSTPLGVQGDIVGTQLDLMVQDLGDYQDAKEERNLPYPKELKKYNALEGLQEFATAHVVLCGTPGSGKTTALHKLFIEKAKQARRKPKGHRFPYLCPSGGTRLRLLIWCVIASKVMVPRWKQPSLSHFSMMGYYFCCATV